MRIFAAALAAASLQCAAAPFAIQLGDTRIGLDAPPGFADTGFTGSPRLQELAEGITSASNRVLLFAISDTDLRRFMSGDQLELKRYMVVATPKGSERDSLSSGDFARLAGGYLQTLGAAPDGGDYQKYLESQPAGQTRLLAELAKQQSVVSVMQGARIAPARRGEPSAHVLSTTTLLLVRGKVLNLTVYAAYETPDDVAWIRSVTAAWIEELKRLNSR